MIRVIFVLAIVALFGTAGHSQEAKKEDRLVIGIFGGALAKQFRANIEQFTKPLGVTAVFVEGTAAQLYARAAAQKSNPQMDLFLGNILTFTAAKSADLTVPLKRELVPNLADVRDGFLDPDGFGQAYMINTLGYVYRKDKFAEAGIQAPNKWAAILDPRLKGRFMIYPPAQQYYGFAQLIGFALTERSNESDLPVILSSIEKMKGNGPQVSATPGQAEDLIQRGEIWAYLASAARGYQMYSKDPRIGFSLASDALVPMSSYIIPVKGSPSPTTAQRLVNFLLSPEMQTQLADQESIIPVNKKAAITDELAQRMGFEAGKSIPPFHNLDVGAIDRNLSRWQENFGKVMAR